MRRDQRRRLITQKATTTPDERPAGNLIAALKNPKWYLLWETKPEPVEQEGLKWVSEKPFKDFIFTH